MLDLDKCINNHAHIWSSNTKYQRGFLKLRPLFHHFYESDLEYIWESILNFQNERLMLWLMKVVKDRVWVGCRIESMASVRSTAVHLVVRSMTALQDMRFQCNYRWRGLRWELREGGIVRTDGVFFFLFFFLFFLSNWEFGGNENYGQNWNHGQLIINESCKIKNGNTPIGI